MGSSFPLLKIVTVWDSVERASVWNTTCTGFVDVLRLEARRDERRDECVPSGGGSIDSKKLSHEKPGSVSWTVSSSRLLKPSSSGSSGTAASMAAEMGCCRAPARRCCEQVARAGTLPAVVTHAAGVEPVPFDEAVPSGQDWK